ncbi:MAG TPA: hypothetical protein VMH35_28945 [Streptosporangiaceae bacterium]|nr:hypothetical protein [Streptosporangiaceae bacterium]
MTIVVAVAIGLAIIVFLIFAGWPLYNTYRTRRQGADVGEAQAYLKARADYEHAEAAHEAEPPPHPPAGGGPAGIEEGDTPLRPRLDQPGPGPDPH